MKRLLTVFGASILAAAFVAAAPPPGPQGKPSEAPAKLRLAFVGQALIHEDLRAVAPMAVEQARGYLKGVDVAFTNLEAAVAPPEMEVELRAPSVHRTTPEVLDALKEMGFNLLSLANNHAWDLGAKALLAAPGEAAKRGFVVAGTGHDANAAAAAGYMETPAGTVALIAMASGASQLAKPTTWAAVERPGVNYLEVQPDGTMNPEHKARILAAVREAARRAKFVIVYHHSHVWSEGTGVEAPPTRNTRIRRFDTPSWLVAWTHELIDAGASLFVAHGNPALHGVEIYKGRPIFYGLGNYIFNSVNTLDTYGPLAYYSAVAYCDFEGDRLVSVRFRPLVLSLDSNSKVPRGIPYLAQGGEADAVLERLVSISRRHGTTLQIDGETASVVLK